MPDVDTGPITPLDQWKLRMAEIEAVPDILLCGAAPWDNNGSPDHRVHCPRGNWTTTDIEAGEGVELVGDLQSLWQTCDRRFDGIFCQSVLEHVQRPWVAIHSMSQLLKPGGSLYVGTHQTFPLHGYPFDFFRFSVDALKTMVFDSGLHTEASAYDHPCTITPVENVVWNPICKAFLGVSICARKPL